MEVGDRVEIIYKSEWKSGTFNMSYRDDIIYRGTISEKKPLGKNDIFAYKINWDNGMFHSNAYYHERELQLIK